MDSREDMCLDLERITEMSEETKQEQQLAETDARSARLEKKVGEILDILKTQTIKTGLDINSLQQENSKLQLRVKENEGTIARLNMKVKALDTKIDDLQIYSMKSNIVFYNIPEETHEDPCSVVEAFMIDNLQIQHRCTQETTLGEKLELMCVIIWVSAKVVQGL